MDDVLRTAEFAVKESEIPNHAPCLRDTESAVGIPTLHQKGTWCNEGSNVFVFHEPCQLENVAATAMSDIEKGTPIGGKESADAGNPDPHIASRKEQSHFPSQA